MMLKNSKAIAGPNGRLIVGIVSDEAVISKAPTLDFTERLELASNKICGFGSLSERLYSI